MNKIRFIIPYSGPCDACIIHISDDGTEVSLVDRTVNDGMYRAVRQGWVFRIAGHKIKAMSPHGDLEGRVTNEAELEAFCEQLLFMVAAPRN